MKLTGRYLVLCRGVKDPGIPKALRDKAGLRVATTSDFPRGAVNTAQLGGADGIYFEALGVAVTSSAPNQLAPLMEGPGSGPILAVEAERVLYPFGVAPLRDQAPLRMPTVTAVGGLRALDLDRLLCTLTPSRVVRVRDVDESTVTWGLTSTRVIESSRTGRNVRVAVLDTGFDLAHPDFAGRAVVSHSFIDGETAQDGHSHGTHCIGTALGCARPPTLPRYGIAPDAEIFAGKVLANKGEGTDGAVLAGIEWAIANGCRVVSMSLGIPMQPGQPFSQVFETVAQRALAANTLIVAAAGNESDRPKGVINPVGHPANCPSIFAVGAVDSNMQLGWFSTRASDPNGGAVDVVAPGVDVYSSVPMPDQYGRKDGTSMATPHVAGIAALYVEANPQATARDVWQLLVQNAKRLDLDPADVGAGLVQAPV